ncbi:MAG TPA: tetratricopeptide repeat protein [Polyangiales bacterium]
MAHAQGGGSGAATANEAKEAFRRGEAAYSAGNYEVAIREWNNAFQADPRPRIQFNLSQAYERLGHLEDAIRALETFLNSGDPDDPTYSDANARLVALRQRLASTGVVVNGGSDGGQILVDDKDWGRTPRPDKITVSPGNHQITIRWPNGGEFRTSVFVPAGQVAEVHVPAEAGGIASGPVAGPAAQPASGSGGARSSDKRVLWYSLGGGAAAVGVGLLAYGIARKVATSDCGGDTWCNQDDVDRADRQAIGGLVSGSVLLAAGAALFVVGAVTHKKSDRQAKTQCGIGYASASCRFQF